MIFYDKPSKKIFEEKGQQYKGQFWREASKADFLGCLRKYQGKIHLVYGQFDRYIIKADRKRVIEEVQRKRQPVMILEGQNHSPWKYDIAQKVYREEINMLNSFQ